MNPNNITDERLTQQVNDRLEKGKPSDYAIVNLLAGTLADHQPQADATFRDNLEARLVAHLHKKQHGKETPMTTATARMPRRAPAYSVMAWTAALIMVVLISAYALMQRSSPTLPAMQAATAEPMHTIVISTQNIEAGTKITDEMVGTINLSALDFQKLQSTQPQRKFYSNVDEVVGQTTTTAMFWFEPIEPVQLGITENCPRTAISCVEKPEGTYTITLPLPMTLITNMGLTAGDRVDVLASADNQLKVVVEDVMLTNIEPDKLTFAATSWKQSVLIWLWRTEQPYALRPHQGQAPAPDNTRVDYSFTAPEALPDGYKFHLIAGLPDSQGYQLVSAPYSLDSIQFTQRDKLMQFWFTDLNMVSITDGTQVVINLPASDAANLDFLLKKGAKLEFIPQ